MYTVALYSSSQSNIVTNVRMCYTLTLLLLREKNSVRNKLLIMQMYKNNWDTKRVVIVTQ